MNQFEKSIEVHFNSLKIFLLYFYDAYGVNLCKKKFGRSTGSAKCLSRSKYYYPKYKDEQMFYLTSFKIAVDFLNN